MIKRLRTFVKKHGWATTAHLLGHRDTWMLKKWICGEKARGIPSDAKDSVRVLLKGGTR